MVSVVDANSFSEDFQSFDSIARRGQEMDRTDERMLSQLLADQVEFANVLVVNKTDLLSDEQLAEIIREVLDGALLRDDEFRAGPTAWLNLADPLPSWQGQNAGPTFDEEADRIQREAELSEWQEFR